jgi:purine-binding chemotaxis protein CheW
VRADGETVSFLVDEIGDVIEVEEDCAEQPPETLRPEMRELVQVVYKLKDRLLMVLDAERTVHGSSGSPTKH